MNNPQRSERVSADAVMHAIMTEDATAPYGSSIRESAPDASNADSFWNADEIVIGVERARYEPSPVEAVVNALLIGALVVTCAIVLAMEGVQMAVA